MLFDALSTRLFALACAAVLGFALGGTLLRAAWRSVCERDVHQNLANLPSHLPARLVFSAFCASIVARYGITAEAVELIMFGCSLLVLAITDLEQLRIPNACVAAAAATRAAYLVAVWASSAAGVPLGLVVARSGTLGAAVGAGAEAAWTQAGGALALALIYSSAVGALVVGGVLLLLTLVMDRVLSRESMGCGDLKLFAVAGAFFGWRQCLLTVVIACAAGVACRLVSAVSEKHAVQRTSSARKTQAIARKPVTFAFGPAIAAACWLTMLV